MEYIKKIFRNYWLLSVFCIVLGTALIVDPKFFTNAIGYVIGGLIAGYGLVELIMYFAKAKDNGDYSSSLVRGIILCAVGIFIIVKPDFIPKIIAVFCGIYMTISGVVGIQNSLNLRNAGADKWKVSCIPAVLTTVVGLLLLFNPLAPLDMAMMILGIALVISGLSNIVCCFSAGKYLKKVKKIEVYSDSSDDSGHKDKNDFIDV